VCEMEFVEVEDFWPCTASDMLTIDAYMERFPESLRKRFTSSEHYRKGALRLEDFPLLLLGRPPSPSRSRDVDWLWYQETYRGIPVMWRRAYASDPPVYDATCLIGVLSRSLAHGECVIAEDPVTRADLMHLVKYGPRSWQREVLEAARWMPCCQEVHITEPGLDLLMRIVPLSLRRALRMAGPDDDDAEDLLTFKPFGGSGVWVMNGYKEDEPLFNVFNFATHFGISKKRLKLFVKEHPQQVTIMNSPNGIPRWGVRRGGCGTVRPSASCEPSAAATPMTLTPPDGDEKTSLATSIEVANQLAREARAQRRALLHPPDPIQKHDRDVPPPQETDPHPNRRQRRSMEVTSSHATRLRHRKAMHEKEATRAFLKQCGPALLKIGSAVHGEAQPEFIEHRLRASLKKVERVSKQQEKRQNIMEERKKIAEMFGV